MTDQTETPAATLEAATTKVALPGNGLTLLGTVHGPGTARALLRLDGGDIRPVETGARVQGATIAAIGEGVVILTEGGRSRRLHLPGA